MKINKVEIQGFRAYKTKKDGTFDFTLVGNKPSNFVAIYAPNGFGKSSFYDAVEWAITNNVERISGEHNKKIIESAARCTKQEGVGQKILRNKDVAIDIPTFVNISTTKMPYSRSLGNPRSDSRDIPRNNRQKENQYFSQVILSQDAIDRFLKEIKPQERYLQFMEYFGGESEIARQKLTALINDNNYILQEFKKNKKALTESLDKPIDTSIFENFNSLVIDLNSYGENINLVSKDFLLENEYKINSLIITRINELKFDTNNLSILKEKLFKLKENIPTIKINIDLIAQQHPRYAKLKKGHSDSLKYQDLNNLYLKLQDDFKMTIEKLEKIKKIDLTIPSYYEFKNKIKSLEEDMKYKNIDKFTNLRKNDEHEILIKKYKEELTTNDKRSEFLRSKIEISDQVYMDIKKYKLLLIDENNKLLEKKNLINFNTTIYNDSLLKIEKLTALDISAELLLTQDISQLHFNSEKMNQLKDIFNEIFKLDLHEKTILQTQDALNQQMSLQDKLVSTGLEIITINSTDICPLCHKSHQSTQNLKNSIVNNNIVSTMLSENIRHLEYLTKQKTKLKAQMESISLEALECKNQLLFNLQASVNDLGNKIAYTNKEKIQIDAEIENLQKQLIFLQESVWHLEKEDLIKRSESEINDLAHKRLELNNKIELVNSTIKEIKVELTKIDSKLEILKNQIILIVSDLKYKEVLDFIESENLLDDDLTIYCKKLITVLETEKEIKNSKNLEILGELKNISEQMSKDGTWIDFSKLKAEKVEVEQTIVQSEAAVKIFFEKINRIIEIPNNSSINFIENEISNAILKADQKYNILINLIKKFNLLFDHLKDFEPYIIRIALKEKLVDVHKNIDQHEKVHEYLSDQRDLILSQIKEKVDAFFFTDLINAIYKKIDPHPEFKEVEFLLDISIPDKPGLNIVLKNDKGETSSPILYFSTAQMNILSLSVFLANALHATDDNGNPIDVIMIDDPIQSMDSINILSTIDLLRSIIIRFDKQIIISTHDKNFFELLRRKIPYNVMGAKFIELQKFGVAAPVEALLET